MPLDAAPFLANPWRMAAEVAAEVLAPPPPVDLNRWAVDRVRFGSESQFPGPYDPERFPFFARILETLSPDHPARVVVLAKSAQLGGTVLAQIFVGGTLDLDPGPVLYTHPTEGNATRWAKTKWKPFVRAVLPDMFAPTTSRDSSNSTLYQERRDGRGWLQISGANSAASLSMITVRRQVQDDLAKWELNNAGDPEPQADSRSKAHEWAKIFKIGTPLIADSCRITRAFRESTQEHYHVPCPHCGHMHPLEWENMLARLDEAHPEEAHFSCPACGGVIEEHHRPAMLRGGQWVAHNPGARTVGFHLWTAYSPLESWGLIAEAWLSAKGDPAREQAFANDVLGRAFQAAGEAPPWEGIRDRAEETGHRRGTIPQGGLILCAGVDVQGDRVECHIKVFGRGLRRWTVDYQVLEGFISAEETRAALDRLLEQTWPDGFGNRRAIDLLAIDGNAYTEDVFDWVRRHPMGRVIMVRGAKSDAAPPLARVQRERGRDGKALRWAKRFFNVGVSPLKMALYKALQVTDPLARAYCGYPKGLDDEFFRQLTAERRVPVRRKDGFVQHVWHKDPVQRNEVLDTEMQAEAAAIRYGWRRFTDERWDQLEAERETPPASGQLDLEELPPAPVAAVPGAAAAAASGLAPGSAPAGERRSGAAGSAALGPKAARSSLAERFARMNGGGA